jgi:hypothetical protein
MRSRRLRSPRCQRCCIASIGSTENRSLRHRRFSGLIRWPTRMHALNEGLQIPQSVLTCHNILRSNCETVRPSHCRTVRRATQSTFELKATTVVVLKYLGEVRFHH